MRRSWSRCKPVAAAEQPRSSAGTPAARLRLRRLGLAEYEPVWREMQTFTDRRDAATDDELWLVQHPPVFTQGQAGS